MHAQVEVWVCPSIGSGLTFTVPTKLCVDWLRIIILYHSVWAFELWPAACSEGPIRGLLDKTTCQDLDHPLVALWFPGRRVVIPAGVSHLPAVSSNQ